MLTIIEDYRHSIGHSLSIDQIRRQLENEYSVIIDVSMIESAEPWTPPTAQEAYEEQLYLGMRMSSAQ